MTDIRIDPTTGLRSVVGHGPGTGLAPDAPEPAADAERDLFPRTAARGVQELLAAPGPLAGLSAEAFVETVEHWRERMRAHAATAAALHLWSDHTGHAELVALPFVPALLARERERFTAHATRTMGGNLLQDLVQSEVRRRERIVAIDDEAVCLAPWASRTPYQLMLIPRTPRKRYEEPGPSGARLLHDALGRLERCGHRALQLWIRTAPADCERYCWRIDVLPRAPSAPDGFVDGTGVHVCRVAPEAAAAELRAA